MVFCILLLDEICGPISSHEEARDFLFQRGILPSSLTCSTCHSGMALVPCSEKKSTDQLIWKCSPCRKYRNIRTQSILAEKKITLIAFVRLVFLLSIKGLSRIAISQLTGLSENTISDWRLLLHTHISDGCATTPPLLVAQELSWSLTKQSLVNVNTTRDRTEKDSGYLEQFTATQDNVFFYLAQQTNGTLQHSYL